MSRSFLKPSLIDFTSNGIDTNTKITSSPSQLDFEGVAAANVTFTGINDLTAAGTITSTTLTDGTLTINAGTITGATSITSTTLTDGTLTINAGTITGATSITLDSLLIQDPGVGTNTITMVAPNPLGASYNLTLPPNDGNSGEFLSTNGAGILSWASAGSGDVVGPASSTDNAIARWDGTTGKLLQNSSATLDDSGNFTGTSYNTASDISLKKNIFELKGALDVLKNIKGYEYNWLDSEDRQWGLIAQQLEECGLGHIIYEKNGIKHVNYISLIPLIIEGIKDLI